MTVADNTSRNQYTATNLQVSFAYTFEIVDKDDIVVLKNGITLSEGTDYTVSNVGNDSGGNVTLTAGATAGDILTLYRDMPYARTQNYTNSGDFLASEVNSDFDNLWLAGEQTNRAFSQSIRKPITDSDSISMELPAAASRAGKYLQFDSTGAVGVTPGGASSSLSRQQFTGNGSTTAFTLSAAPDASGNGLQIYIDGVYQESTTYSVSGSTLTFTEAPPLNSGIEVVKLQAEELGSTTSNLITYTPAGTGAVDTTVQAKLRETVSVKDFGAVGDGVTDDTAAVTAFLTSVISTGDTGIIPDGTYMVDQITLASANLRIRGNGVLKANGSNRKNMIKFTGVSGVLDIDGITIDANNKVARGLDIENLGSSSSALGYIYFGPSFSLVNAKNNAPDTFAAFGIYIEGGFEKVTFAGEIDGVDSTSTSSADSFGFNVTWDATDSNDWVRSTVIASTSRIRNVKNSNVATEDADGIVIAAPTTQNATLAVNPGALFEECEGRAIKSQVLNNVIVGAIIRRTLYDGLNEIDLQYGGGTVQGVQCIHEGTRSNYIISASQRATPDNTHFSFTDNELVVTGSPSSNTNVMLGLDVTGNSDVNTGVTILNNKVKGTVNYMVATRNADVAGNRIVVKDNWAETIGTAYIQVWRYGTGTPNLNLVFEGNGCETSCTGGALVNTSVTIESFDNNYNISSIGGTLSELTISSGSITPTVRVHSVDTEGDAATDDLDTIAATYFDVGSELTLKAADSSRTVVAKDGTGNLVLAGDFSMDASADTLKLFYTGTVWQEISRSNNS